MIGLAYHNLAHTGALYILVKIKMFKIAENRSQCYTTVEQLGKINPDTKTPSAGAGVTHTSTKGLGMKP